MKINKPHTAAYYSIICAQVVITILLVTFFSSLMVRLYFLHWVALIILLFSLAFPFSKKPFVSPTASDKRILSQSQWYLKIVMLQASLLLTYLGFCECIGQLAPSLVDSNNQLFILSLQMQTVHWGLFPWAVIIILAAGFMHVAYRQRQHALLSHLIHPFLPNQPQSLAWAIYNVTAKEPGSFALASSFAIFSLLIASLLSTGKIATGFSVAALFLGFPAALFGATRYFKKATQFVFSHRFNAAIMMLAALLISGIVLYVLNALFHPLATYPVKPFAFLTYLQKQSWANFWNIVAASWWLGWTIFSAIYIAHISYGKSLRQIVVAVLALPIAISVLLMLMNAHHQGVAQQTLSTLWGILGIIGFIGLLFIFMRKPMLSCITISTLPQLGKTKPRSYYYYARRVIQFGLIILFVYLPLGIYSVSFIGFGLTTPLILLLFFIIPAFVKMQIHNMRKPGSS